MLSRSVQENWFGTAVSAPAALLGACALLLISFPVQAQRAGQNAPLPYDPANWRTEKTSEGVYAFIAPDGVTPIVSGNTVVVVGDSSVLVVDPGQFPSMARHQIAEIRRLTSRPVRYVVNTHWHPDHWLGNGEYAREFPGVTFIATPHTREQMLSRAVRFITPKYASDTRDAVVNTRKRVDLSAFKARFCGDNIWCQFGFDGNFLRPALPRAYQEAREGRLKDEG